MRSWKVRVPLFLMSCMPIAGCEDEIRFEVYVRDILEIVDQTDGRYWAEAVYRTDLLADEARCMELGNQLSVELGTMLEMDADQPVACDRAGTAMRMELHFSVPIIPAEGPSPPDLVSLAVLRLEGDGAAGAVYLSMDNARLDQLDAAMDQSVLGSAFSVRDLDVTVAVQNDTRDDVLVFARSSFFDGRALFPEEQDISVSELMPRDGVDVTLSDWRRDIVFQDPIKYGLLHIARID